MYFISLFQNPTSEHTHKMAAANIELLFPSAKSASREQRPILALRHEFAVSWNTPAYLCSG
jgi:hypothetical protein